MTLKEGKDVSIENEMYEVRQVLKLSGGCSNFSWMKSDDCVKIDDSVEIISRTDFQSCSSLNEVILSSDSHLKEIRGFRECTSLCRIEIPSSVEVIDIGCPISLSHRLLRSSFRQLKHRVFIQVPRRLYSENEFSLALPSKELSPLF
jgi:hypothetical protein